MFTLLFNEPLVFFTWVLAFLIALSVHEFSHALVATLQGDTTAKRAGRLTLNPASHVDLIGLLAVVLVGFGWGRPVPYNPYNLKWPKWGPVFIAFAGPLSNFILALISILLLSAFGQQLGMDNLLTIFLLVCAQLNVALMAFNFIPLPPLDGSKALLALLDKPKFAAARMFIESRGPYLLLLIIILDSFMHLGIFSGLIDFVWSLIGHIVPVPNYLL